MPSENNSDWARIVAESANSYMSGAMKLSFSTKKAPIPQEPPAPMPSTPRFKLKYPCLGDYTASTSGYETACMLMDRHLSANPETKQDYLSTLSLIMELLSNWKVNAVNSGVHYSTGFDTKLIEFAPIWKMGLHAESSYYAIANTEPFDASLAKALWLRLLFLAYDVLALNCELRGQYIGDKQGWSKCVNSGDYGGQTTFDNKRSHLDILKAMVRIHWSETLTAITGHCLLDTVEKLQPREPQQPAPALRTVGSGQIRRTYRRTDSQETPEVQVYATTQQDSWSISYNEPAAVPPHQSVTMAELEDSSFVSTPPRYVPSNPVEAQVRRELTPRDIAEMMGITVTRPRPANDIEPASDDGF